MRSYCERVDAGVWSQLLAIQIWTRRSASPRKRRSKACAAASVLTAHRPGCLRSGSRRVRGGGGGRVAWCRFRRRFARSNACWFPATGVALSYLHVAVGHGLGRVMKVPARCPEPICHRAKCHRTTGTGDLGSRAGRLCTNAAWTAAFEGVERGPGWSGDRQQTLAPMPASVRSATPPSRREAGRRVNSAAPRRSRSRRTAGVRRVGPTGSKGRLGCWTSRSTPSRPGSTPPCWGGIPSGTRRRR